MYLAEMLCDYDEDVKAARWLRSLLLEISEGEILTDNEPPLL
jgi:hypothetical protein